VLKLSLNPAFKSGLLDDEIASRTELANSDEAWKKIAGGPEINNHNEGLYKYIVWQNGDDCVSFALLHENYAVTFQGKDLTPC
jgi:hypothetical protein